MAASPETKKQYAVIKSFKALNTKANRTAIGEDEFYWVENAHPIGYGNLKVVPNVRIETTGGNAVTWSNTISEFTTVNLNNEDYVLAFQANGAAQYYDVANATVGSIATGGTFSASGVRAKQWKNDRILISDPDKGLYNWNGANLISIGSVGQIGITNPGSGYTSAPAVVISAPNEANGVQAQALATVSNLAGSIVAVEITNIGTGYTSVPVITIDPPQSSYGVTAQAVATIQSGNIVVISVTNPGSGYTTAPSVTITGGGGTSGAATAKLGTGIVSSITIIEAGSGYTSAPTVTITGGGGANAAAKAGYLTFRKGIVGVLVTNSGTGYTSSPTVTITGGGGANANGIAIIAGGQITQVIMDNPGTGYTSNPTVSFSGGGGANAAAIAVATTRPITDIATFQGRAWVAQGRTVFYSAAGTYNDFSSVSAGNITIDDDTLHSDITSLVSANNFLYVFGENSINVFSDVRVNTTGQTLFTNTNVSASVGSRRNDAIFPYFRSLLFMNDYGIYALVGATTSKLSDALDGIFPYIDFSKPVSGGQVLINNILCAAFNFYITGPIGNARYVQAVFFDKKWFLTNQGEIKYTSSIAQEGGVYLYGTNGTNLRRLYGDNGNSITAIVQTALLPLGDTIRDKQALKFGIEATSTQGAAMDVTVDSEYTSSPIYSFSSVSTWANNQGTIIPWYNNSFALIPWIGGYGYGLYKSDAQQYGKYLGLTITSTTPGLIFNTMELEYELRARF